MKPERPIQVTVSRSQAPDFKISCTDFGGLQLCVQPVPPPECESGSDISVLGIVYKRLLIARGMLVIE